MISTKMPIYIVFILNFSLLSCNSTKQISSEKKNLKFPEDWIGTYKGVLNWYAGEKHIEIPIKMELIKNTENEILWRTTYDSTQTFPFKTVKDYILKMPDSLGKGNYIIDEKNGIFIDVRHLDNSIYSSYDVVNEETKGITRILTIDKLIGKKTLYHEIISYLPADKQSGNTIDSKGFTIFSTNKISTQKAVLNRVKEKGN